MDRLCVKRQSILRHWIDWCLNGDAWSIRLLKISQGWACWCSLGCGPEHILELWLGIGVKHVAFYGLWPKMTSFELWLGIADEHEKLLSCGSGWRVLLVWVCWLWPVRMGPDGFPSSVILLTSLVVLGRYRLCSYLGTPPGVTVC